MSAFSRPDFVKEFAYRTKSNYYSLMIANAKEQNQTDAVKKYERRLALLKSDMALNEYHTGENYFEVTQLINSLVGLLVFPEQQYFEELRFLKDRLITLDTIIDNNSGSFFCSYREKQKVFLSEEEHNIYFCPRGNKEKDRIIKRKLSPLKPEEKTPFNVIKHMRNAVSHERLAIEPVSRNKRITSVVFEDYAKAKINHESKIEYTRPEKNNRDVLDYIRENKQEDITYGYFRLEIDVRYLEMVLMEICDAILSVAREA